jgi:hypothetical protein
MNQLQDAVRLADDFQLQTAITYTEVELAYVRKLIELRGNTPRMVNDELEVLARLADLKLQLERM